MAYRRSSKEWGRGVGSLGHEGGEWAVFYVPTNTV